MPETRQLQTCAAQKSRAFPKETAVKRQYEERGSGSRVPSRNTGRGVYGYGKPKDSKIRKHRETNKRATRKSQAQGTKVPGVIAIHTRNQTI